MSNAIFTISVILLSSLVVFTPATAVAQQTGADVARVYRESHEAEIIGDFARLLALPNVASDSAGINRNAEYLRDELRALGIDAELLRLADQPRVPPIVFGEIRV